MPIREASTDVFTDAPSVNESSKSDVQRHHFIDMRKGSLIIAYYSECGRM